MGLMPSGAGNPFTKLDKQSVIGALKATGSRDPDMLYAQKNQLLASAKHLKLLGLILMVGGAFLTVTVRSSLELGAGDPALRIACSNRLLRGSLFA